MGCDIHEYVEVRTPEGWRSVDVWEQDEYEDQKERLVVPYEKQFLDIGRNYDLFAILAGVDTGDGFVPIHELRGLPADCDQRIRAASDDYGVDGHSHSYATMAELLAYDWTRKTKHRGILDAHEYLRWGRYDRPAERFPSSWCGGISGPGIEIVQAAEADRRIAALRASEAAKGKEPWQAEQAVEATLKGMDRLHVACEWTTPYFRSCKEFLSESMPKMWRLGKPEDVRLVFWFDN